MAADHRSKLHPMVRKLQSIFDLRDDERQAIESLPMQVVPLRADQDIVREGDRPSRCCVVLEGFTCSYKVTGAGKRQILAFHMAGDVPDLQSLHLKVLDNSLATITPCRVGFVQHEALRQLCESYPRITSALWRETLVDASVFREWMMNIGQRGGASRVAHLLCELVVRMRAVGLVDNTACALPMTQGELADALSFSNVHVNRVLQELRASDLIALRGGSMEVLDWEELKALGDFDPTYLHLTEPELAVDPVV